MRRNMVARRFPVLIAAILFVFFCHSAQVYAASAAEGRYALVIGNGAYPDAPLKNPPNDAEDMAAALEHLGFSVQKLIDADQVRMRKAIRHFGRQLEKGGVGLFFYAGHGMQVQGVNYMIPVGAVIEEEDEVEDYAVDVGMVLRKMQTAGNNLNMIFLDACRNNPFQRSFRSAQRGLALMDAPSGSMISYATAPGRTAADGDGRNGIFTKHLLLQLNQPETVELAQFMKKVGRGVQEETASQQVPWISSSITGDFYFRREEKENRGIEESPPPPLRQSTVSSSLDAEEEFWKAIAGSELPQDYQDYLKAYPEGRFKHIAQVRLRQLQNVTSAPLEGTYRVNGTNPDGRKYTGEATIVREGERYTIRWKIAKDTFSGVGKRTDQTLTVEWGASSPVVYTITGNGVLEGAWGDGKARETLTPIR